MSFVLKTLEQLDLPKDKFVVVGSGIMDVLGIREADDVDIIVPEDVFAGLKKSAWQEVVKPHGIALELDSFEAGLSWDSKNENPNFDELYDESVEIDGFHFSPLERILHWKQNKRRPKDLKDIELIKEYLAANK